MVSVPISCGSLRQAQDGQTFAVKAVSATDTVAVNLQACDVQVIQFQADFLHLFV